MRDARTEHLQRDALVGAGPGGTEHGTRRPGRPREFLEGQGRVVAAAPGNLLDDAVQPLGQRLPVGASIGRWRKPGAQAVVAAHHATQRKPKAQQTQHDRHDQRPGDGGSQPGAAQSDRAADIGRRSGRANQHHDDHRHAQEDGQKLAQQRPPEGGELPAGAGKGPLQQVEQQAVPPRRLEQVQQARAVQAVFFGQRLQPLEHHAETLGRTMPAPVLGRRCDGGDARAGRGAANGVEAVRRRQHRDKAGVGDRAGHAPGEDQVAETVARSEVGEVQQVTG